MEAAAKASGLPYRRMPNASAEIGGMLADGAGGAELSRQLLVATITQGDWLQNKRVKTPNEAIQRVMGFS
jgi:hypothetical protein